MVTNEHKFTCYRFVTTCYPFIFKWLRLKNRSGNKW